MQPDQQAPLPDTVAAAIDRSLDAYDSLTLLGEEVEDEWQYVQDLSGAWRARFEEVVAARGDEPLASPAASAVEGLADEVGRISDPHRAIDWLSTFPQAVLVALGERP